MHKPLIVVLPLLLLIVWGYPPQQLFVRRLTTGTRKARVTYRAETTWFDGAGPAEGSIIYIRGEINRDAVLLVKQVYEKIKLLTSTMARLEPRIS
jgi:hypothetical protein